MPSPWQPTLEGTTLLLRPLREEDFPALHAAASDPLIWEVHPEPDRHRLEKFQVFFRTGMESRGALAILDRRTGEIIGSSRYTDHNPPTSSVEIGYTFLTRPYWGGTTNRELKTLMLEHAFRQVETVYFVVGENNHRSRGAMTKIGGTLIPTLKSLPLRGDLGTSVVFRITRDDWALRASRAGA